VERGFFMGGVFFSFFMAGGFFVQATLLFPLRVYVSGVGVPVVSAVVLKSRLLGVVICFLEDHKTLKLAHIVQVSPA